MFKKLVQVLEEIRDELKESNRLLAVQNNLHGRRNDTLKKKIRLEHNEGLG